MKQKQANKIIRIKKQVILLLLLSLFARQAYPQYHINYDTDHLATLTFEPETHDGFRISVSLVALFTAGAADRNGFRLGGGISFSQTIDNWTFSVGADAYKAKQKFGMGTSYAGAAFDDGKYGASYYLNKYYQGDKQVSGLAGLHLNDFRINFEDDILATPVVGFKIYDRYRTAALEVRYKGFMIGANVYTTDMNGLTDASLNNGRGTYATGRQLSSPIYIGYTTNDLLLRYGINNKAGGLIGQNGWHRYLFYTPDFNSGSYNNQFIQIGVDKPYTLY